MKWSKAPTWRAEQQQHTAQQQHQQQDAACRCMRLLLHGPLPVDFTGSHSKDRCALQQALAAGWFEWMAADSVCVCFRASAQTGLSLLARPLACGDSVYDVQWPTTAVRRNQLQ